MSISIKNFADATLMSQRMGRANNLVKESIQRFSSGVRLQNGRHAPEAPYFLAKFQVSHKANTVNALFLLKTQESALKSTAKAVDRIATLKTLYSNPFKSDAGRENYDKEFNELAGQLVFLTQCKFNNISLFSETESGFGLILYSTKSACVGVDSSSVISISQKVIEVDDFERITETGATTNRGFGGLEVVSFLHSESMAQVGTLTPGVKVSKSEVFSVSIREQTSVLKAESDTLISYTATAADESSSDPYQSIRDEHLNLVSYSATLSGFLTADATTSDPLTLSSKIAGDPFKISSIDYPGFTVSLNSIQTQANITNLTRVDTGALNNRFDAVPLGDSIPKDLQRDTYSSTSWDGSVSPSSVNKSLNILTKVVVQDVAEQSRLTKANEHLGNNSQNYEQSQIRINDLDFSGEYSQVMKFQHHLDGLPPISGKTNIGAITTPSLLNKSNYEYFNLISQ